MNLDISTNCQSHSKKHSNSDRHSDSGFTLLEIVIAVALLAFISVFVAQSIRNGLNARNKIQRDIDSSVGLREALNLMSRDIQLAFHFRDINVELYNSALKAQCKKAGGKTPNPPAPGAPPAPPAPPPSPGASSFTGDRCNPKSTKILTQFVGEPEKLNFATRSNIRTQKDDPTSDQAEVGYQLKDCRSRAKLNSSTQTSKCLWRRFSPVIDDNPREGGTDVPVLENVKSLAFRYLGPGYENEWLKTWSSDNQTAGTDDRMKGKFPLAVEITMVVEDKSVNPSKEIGMTMVAQVRFPNNDEKKSSTADGTVPGTGDLDDDGAGDE